MNRLSAFHLGVYTDLHLWALLEGSSLRIHSMFETK